MENVFIDQLISSKVPTALKLAGEFTNLAHTPDYHQQNAKNFLKKCSEQLKNENNVKQFILLLAQRRAEIKASEISKNQRG